MTNRIKQLTIEQVKKKYEIAFMRNPGVEGVGITEKNNKKVIIIYCSIKPEELSKKIPQEVEGYKVVFQHTGGFNIY